MNLKERKREKERERGQEANLIAFGNVSLLAAEDVARHFGLDVVLEGTERALVHEAVERGPRPHVVLGLDVRRHQVRLFGLEGAVVAAEARRRAVAERERRAPVLRHHQPRLALEVGPVALAQRQPVRVVLGPRYVQT